MPAPGARAEQSAYRVLIVDDSAVVRQALREIIESDPSLEVMGAVGDPYAAAQKIRHETPDAIILDLEMPKMDGLTFLRKLMAQHPLPVVVCSSHASANSEILVKARLAGAVDVICKPQMAAREFFDAQRTAICNALRSAAQAKVKGASFTKSEPKLTADVMVRPPKPGAAPKSSVTVIAVGASTGGTDALRVFLQAMPVDCPPIAVVQHMPKDFTSGFAKTLNDICTIQVKEAKNNDILQRGQALIAPGNLHMMLKAVGSRLGVEVRDGPLVSRHRPSVDVLFRSAARTVGEHGIGIIMTGMGDDGARGLKEMRDVGARTLGQDEATCIVYGMPKAAKAYGAVEEELPLTRLATAALRFGQSAC